MERKDIISEHISQDGDRHVSLCVLVSHFVKFEASTTLAVVEILPLLHAHFLFPFRFVNNQGASPILVAIHETLEVHLLPSLAIRREPDRPRSEAAAVSVEYHGALGDWLRVAVHEAPVHARVVFAIGCALARRVALPRNDTVKQPVLVVAAASFAP